MEAHATILLVEDDPNIATLMHDALTDEGYRVLMAEIPAAGCTILAAFRVGLVLTDGFPGSTDQWVPLAPLVAQAGTTPVILCSAHSPARYADYADHGFAALCSKPFDLDALAALVAGKLRPRSICGGVEDALHHRQQVA